MRSVLGYAALACVAAAVLAGAAIADPPSPGNPAGRSGDILGIVPSVAASHNAGGGGSGGNLVYHGGPVELTNKVYAIYWVPPGYSVSAKYESLINRFFGDVAADNGKTSNVYYASTQYYNGSGQHIAYSSSFGGSALDADPLPASGCSDSYTSVCLSDAQIRSEVAKVAAANGWAANGTTEFFMFTAKGIGSCYSSSSCAFSSYCAYHSNFSSGGSTYLYANMPYADTVPSACDAGQHPNGDDADATINVTSHEHNETITDELGNAWYDRRGYEDGDKCAWNFGAVSGPSGAEYNQTINGNHYFLQQEWSNASSRCVLQGT
ncbi:MAG TPA: hypothetical protein VFA05_09820 [Gaiellaceae bacterium]|nr:hypothetical protein [Gaiellaceae bacterium]